MKLHLGCGQKYLDGYVNIDFPIAKHSVQQVKADHYQDIKTLEYPAGSIQEIRLHHVFEHFTRPVALALLCNWRDMLEKNGRLIIETPDVMACYWQLVNPFISVDHKFQVSRHLYGSHEAEWAAHWDGWYEQKYRLVLTRLGYRIEDVAKSRWGPLRNITITAHKNHQKFSTAEYQKAVETLLEMSTIRVNTTNPTKAEGSEKELLHEWLESWRANRHD